ncbi:MAG: hypothetical protein ACI4WT_02615 [Oligosphaeraceae bacterium]
MPHTAAAIRHLPLLGLLAAVALLAGCRTAPVPPGFARVGAVLQSQTSDIASPAAIFSLMQWYAETTERQQVPPEWRDFADGSRTRALEELHLQWRARLIDQGRGLAIAHDADFLALLPETLASRTDWDAMTAQTHSLSVLVAAPQTVDIPLAECESMSFWERRPQDRQAFAAWARQRQTLTLPDPPGLRRLDLIRQLDAIHAAIALKRHILAIRDDADRKRDAHQFTAALDLLGKLRAELDAKGQNLDAIGDSATLEQLDATLAQLPTQAITFHLGRLRSAFAALAAQPDAADSALADAERSLTATLAEWQADTRYQNALRTLLPQTRQTLQTAADARAAAWRRQLDALAAQRRYWDAAELCRRLLPQLATRGHQQFGAYAAIAASDQQGAATFAARLADALRAHASAFLPQALRHFADAAERSLANGKPGFAAALGRMADAMRETLQPSPSPDLDAHAAPLRKLAAQAVDTIAAQVLRRTVTVSDMTSSIPGSGLTYTRDLIHALRGLLEERQLDTLISISAPTGEQPSPYAYSLFNGVVADFDGNETVERRNSRIIRRFGEIRKADNPQAQDNPEAPKSIYTQEVYEQLISIREIERLAHVRAFITMRGPGFSTLVEVNEFYKRQFIIEESHPFNDLRVIDVLRTYDLDKHPVQDAEPVLRYDRVWTPGEMLDWARKDSLKVFTLKILFHLNQFPFMLANQARHFADAGDLVEATEFWACCAELTRLLDPRKLTTSGLDQTSRSSASCYEDCLAALQRQYAELTALVRTAPADMARAANDLFVRTTTPKTAP